MSFGQRPFLNRLPHICSMTESSFPIQPSFLAGAMEHQYRHHTPRSSPEAVIARRPTRLRSSLTLVLGILTALSSPFMAWKGLCLLTNSAVPIVCVISESMAPAFHRGDLLFLWNWTTAVQAGEIPVVWFNDSPLPMVHRVIKVINEGNK